MTDPKWDPDSDPRRSGDKPKPIPRPTPAPEGAIGAFQFLDLEWPKPQMEGLKARMVIRDEAVEFAKMRDEDPLVKDTLADVAKQAADAMRRLTEQLLVGDTMERHTVGDVVIKTHPQGVCKGRNCVIHNPSDHALRAWPRKWRTDINRMERVCPHGVGHPDPDEVAYRFNELGQKDAGTHGCDGCCPPAHAVYEMS